MTDISRQREMDLAPLVQQMTVRIEAELFAAARGAGRNQEDMVLASLLALAMTASAIRRVAGIPVSTWADCNRIAASPTSLSSSLPMLPATLALDKRLYAQATKPTTHG